MRSWILSVEQRTLQERKSRAEHKRWRYIHSRREVARRGRTLISKKTDMSTHRWRFGISAHTECLLLNFTPSVASSKSCRVVKAYRCSQHGSWRKQEKSKTSLFGVLVIIGCSQSSAAVSHHSNSALPIFCVAPAHLRRRCGDDWMLGGHAFQLRFVWDPRRRRSCQTVGTNVQYRTR